jgi:tRNA nucleotidyltransferase (CCA-adding enzyme)
MPTMNVNEIPWAVSQVCSTLEDNGFEAWVVGGCVRDTIMGRTPNDWDVATNAKPEEVMACFPRVEPTGIEHGTVTVIMTNAFGPTAGFPIEVTTFRGEGSYSDGRRPDSVTFVDEIEEDLMRRDFTFNGRKDCGMKFIQAVGNPRERFMEDGLRVMRALRFASQLGFYISTETLSAMNEPEVQAKCMGVAKERITTEFCKMLMGNDARNALDFMATSGLLVMLFPGLKLPAGDERFRHFIWVGKQAGLAARLAALLGTTEKGKIHAHLARLRLSAADVVETAALVDAFWSPPGASGSVSDGDARRWVAKAGRTRYKAALGLIRDFGTTDDFSVRIEFAMESATAMSVAELALNGEQVGEIINAKPGKMIGEALRFLLNKVLDKPELNMPHRLTMLLMKDFA